MKEALDEQGLKPFLMCQPLGYKTPDAGNMGWIDLPEFPYATEPRHLTRIEAMTYAREAYDLGVRYIGGCCGFESYHIRAMAEELQAERGGRLPEGSSKSEFARGLFMTAARAKANPKCYAHKVSMDFWKNMAPCTGRPLSSAMCKCKNPEALQPSILT